MQINVSFRHIEPSDPLKLYAEDKLSRVKRFLEEPIEAHVVLKVEKFRHIAEVSIDAPGLHLNGAEETDDMYSSIDLLADSVEGQVKRGKNRVVRRRRATGNSKEAAVLAEVPAEGRFAGEDDEEPLIIKAEQVYAKPMDLDEAVVELDVCKSEFLVFNNRRTSRINVLYRRKDGNLGLIETVG
jgi:putative sigma-54 modulation protein